MLHRAMAALSSPPSTSSRAVWRQTEGVTKDKMIKARFVWMIDLQPGIERLSR
jgi:hypothetical protein